MDKQIVMRWWQVPREEIPAGRDERIEWLFGWWERIDAWIEQQPAEDRRVPSAAASWKWRLRVQIFFLARSRLRRPSSTHDLRRPASSGASTTAVRDSSAAVGQRLVGRGPPALSSRPRPASHGRSSASAAGAGGRGAGGGVGV